MQRHPEGKELIRLRLDKDKLATDTECAMLHRTVKSAWGACR